MVCVSGAKTTVVVLKKHVAYIKIVYVYILLGVGQGTRYQILDYIYIRSHVVGTRTVFTVL